MLQKLGIHRLTDRTPVETIRALGFDNELRPDASKETLFFIDALGRDSFAATPEAVDEAIKFFESWAETLCLYKANGYNSKTHEWNREEKKTPVCELRVGDVVRIGRGDLTVMSTDPLTLKGCGDRPLVFPEGAFDGLTKVIRGAK